MSSSETPKFSLKNEVEKLRQYLALPITHVEFDKRYEYGKTYRHDNMELIWINAKLYVKDDMIGTIPYFSSEHGVGYDTSNHGVFAWDKIYAQFRQVIFDKIFQQEPLAVTAEAAEYEPRAYLALNVKDKEGALIKKAGCTFVDNEWNVHVYGLNAVTGTVRKTIKVTLTPPPPLNITGDQKSPL